MMCGFRSLGSLTCVTHPSREGHFWWVPWAASWWGWRLCDSSRRPSEAAMVLNTGIARLTRSSKPLAEMTEKFEQQLKKTPLMKAALALDTCSVFAAHWSVNSSLWWWKEETKCQILHATDSRSCEKEVAWEVPCSFCREWVTIECKPSTILHQAPKTREPGSVGPHSPGWPFLPGPRVEMHSYHLHEVDDSWSGCSTGRSSSRCWYREAVVWAAGGSLQPGPCDKEEPWHAQEGWGRPCPATAAGGGRRIEAPGGAQGSLL